VRLTVSDHGPGIEPKELRRLFRPFHKSARDAAQSAPGVGLGLALSRRLARVLGGDLHVLRDRPAGAAFCLRLPPV
jgi:signal transduction histidine kinase